MKKGLIVYLTDSNTLPITFDADEALTSLSLSCDHSSTLPLCSRQGPSMTFLQTQPGI